jgi:hypothetical protein
MEELNVYPEGGANLLEPDAMVLVSTGSSVQEKMVSQLATGDVYTTKMNRKMHKRTVKQCIEEMLSRKMSITYKFFPCCYIVISHITKGEVLNFPIEEDLDIEDIQYVFNYALDFVQEDEL